MIYPELQRSSNGGLAVAIVIDFDDPQRATVLEAVATALDDSTRSQEGMSVRSSADWPRPVEALVEAGGQTPES